MRERVCVCVCLRACLRACVCLCASVWGQGGNRAFTPSPHINPSLTRARAQALAQWMATPGADSFAAGGGDGDGGDGAGAGGWYAGGQ